MKVYTMTDIIYYVAASADGYIANSDGDVQWLSPFEGGSEDYGYSRFYNSVDALIMGSRTYEQCLTFGQWPYPEKPCWVFSRRRLRITAPAITLTDSKPGLIVAALDSRGFRRAWLVGGATLAASIRAERLMSEYIVSVIPVILGSGIPWLAPGGSQETLKLVESKSYSNGIVQLRYRSDPDVY